MKAGAVMNISSTLFVCGVMKSIGAAMFGVNAYSDTHFGGKKNDSSNHLYDTRIHFLGRDVELCNCILILYYWSFRVFSR